MKNKIQKVTIKGLVCQDGKAFMVRDQAGNWELPGGKIDFGEHPQETLKREFIEELGIKKVEIGELLNVFDFLSQFENNDCQFIVLIFECKADLSKIEISNEHYEYKWIALDEVASHPMKSGYAESINKYFEQSCLNC